LSAARQDDLDDVDLAEYKGVRPPLDQWDAVSEICLRMSERLLQGFTEMLTADASIVATAARESIEDWQTRRARGDKTAEPRLPGLKG
jgi:phage-related baseplate assembly protein